MRVAVTGGSGVVGTPLVRHLVEAGHEVRALARSDRSADRVRQAGADAVIGDLLDPEALDRLVGGAAWVFHVAGVNELCPVDRDAMWRVNVEGTRAVLDASHRAGVGRLVHTSSAATIGERDGEIGTESTPHRGSHLSTYERTKSESEALALDAPHGLEVVVVNPSSVQGPGRATGTGRLLLQAMQGRLPFLYDATFSLVDIDDCARGHVLAAEHGLAGERYLLSGATLTIRETVSMLTAITGRVYRIRYLRPGVFSALGWAIGSAYPVVGRQPPICPEAVRVMRHGHRYDGSRATRDLGLVYTTPEETFRRTIDWFVTAGLLRLA